ncbi:MAG: DUF262 domain-containing protein [bacterium]
MANWESYSVADVVQKIKDDMIVLPVIQRKLVWDEEKMELLFDTLLKRNSFGGIMALEEEKNSNPLFAFRRFTIDGSLVMSEYVERLPQSHSLIIDGQQRFQAFYIGLTGSINGKSLFFDLFSDYRSLEFDFRFTNDITKLPTQNGEKDYIKQCLWHRVPDLYKRLQLSNDQYQVSDEVIKEKQIEDPNLQKTVQINIGYFYQNIFGGKHVGIAKVDVNKTLNEISNRQRIVELFRRLNDGGTKLSAFDLMASILKGFEWKMEAFLHEVLQDYQDIGLTQDNLIKLIFLLRDDHAKEMSHIAAEDAQFAVDNKERIRGALKAMRDFLTSAHLIDYYLEASPSFIPLFFITYYLFHKKLEVQELYDYWSKYDTSNTDYVNIYKWIYMSYLSRVFRSRGAGWIPYKTGIRKILGVMKKNKSEAFPLKDLIMMYKNHPVEFYLEVTEDNLKYLDSTFLFYILYDRQRTIRLQDLDHIHPSSLLYNANINSEMINTIENHQLLDIGTNRGEKSNKSLKEWVENCVLNRSLYLRRHLIPEDETLWDIINYDKFISARRKLMIQKLFQVINI